MHIIDQKVTFTYIIPEVIFKLKHWNLTQSGILLGYSIQVTGLQNSNIYNFDDFLKFCLDEYAGLVMTGACPT